MIALYIIIGILVLLAVCLLLPIKLYLTVDDSASFTVSLFGIKIYYSQKKDDEKPKSTPKTQLSDKKPQKSDSYFAKMRKEKGLSETVKFIASLVKIVLKKVKWLVKRLKFSKFILKIVVASDNAAKTAVEYGAVCSAVYPAVTFIASNVTLKAKQIDISANFDRQNPELYLSFSVSGCLVTVGLAVLSVYREFKKLQKDSETNG